jgi:hypothetical protein
MSLTGKPTDCNTITIVTKPALGILAAPIDATVAVKLEMTIQFSFVSSSKIFTTNLPYYHVFDKSKRSVIHLGYEYRSNCLVQRSTVHVNC